MKLLMVFRLIYRLGLGLFWAVMVSLLIPVIFVVAQRRAVWTEGFPELCMHLLSRRFYSSFNVKVQYFGEPVSKGNMTIANHVSWLDIVVLTGRFPFGFVAKSEVRHWPIFGAVGAAMGTLFINRTSKFSVYRSLPAGQAILQRQQTLAVFPEGTTTKGEQALPFYPMTFEIAVREKALVQPIALRYLNADGTPSQAAPFIDDDGFLQSLVRVACSPVTYVEVHLLPPLDASTLSRKQLAYVARERINEVLALQGHSQPISELSLSQP